MTSSKCLYIFNVKLYSTKEIESLQKLWFSNSYILPTQCRRPWIFQTINSFRSIIPSVNYQRFATSGCKDMRISKYQFLVNTQFLFQSLYVRQNTKFVIHKVVILFCGLPCKWLDNRKNNRYSGTNYRKVNIKDWIPRKLVLNTYLV